jgi:hypothetical protein
VHAAAAALDPSPSLLYCACSVWRVGEEAPPAASTAPANPTPRPSTKSSPPPPSFRDLMRLDSAIDDDAAPSPHAQQTTKMHALADIDIDNCAAAPAAAAAAQGQRLLKQMQEKAAGEGKVVAKVLMTRAVPVVKQASASFVLFRFLSFCFVFFRFRSFFFCVFSCSCRLIVH